MLVSLLIEAAADCVPAYGPAMDREVGERGVGHTMEVRSQQTPLSRTEPYDREVVTNQAACPGMAGG